MAEHNGPLDAAQADLTAASDELKDATTHLSHEVAHPHSSEQELELRYEVKVRLYGHKHKIERDALKNLAKHVRFAFGAEAYVRDMHANHDVGESLLEAGAWVRLPDEGDTSTLTPEGK